MEKGTRFGEWSMASILLKKRSREEADIDDGDSLPQKIQDIESTTEVDRRVNKRTPSTKNNVLHNTRHRTTSTLKRPFSATKVDGDTLRQSVDDSRDRVNGDELTSEEGAGDATDRMMQVSPTPNKRRRAEPCSSNVHSNTNTPNNAFLRSVHIENAIQRGRASLIRLSSQSYRKDWLDETYTDDSNADATPDGRGIDDSTSTQGVIFSFRINKGDDHEADTASFDKG